MADGEVTRPRGRFERIGTTFAVAVATALVGVALFQAVQTVHGSPSFVALGEAPRSMASLVGVGLLGLLMPSMVVVLLRSPRPLRSPVACLLACSPYLVALGTSRLLAMAPRRAAPEFSSAYAEALSLAFDSAPRHAVLSVGTASTLACLFAIAHSSLAARLSAVADTVPARTRRLAWLGAGVLVLGGAAVPYMQTSRELAEFGSPPLDSLVPGVSSLALLGLALVTLVPAFVVLFVDRDDAALEARRGLLAALVFAGPAAQAAGIENLLAGMPLAPAEPSLRAADLVLLFHVLPGLALAVAGVACVLVVAGVRRHGLRFTDLAWLAPIAAFFVLGALSLREGIGGWTFNAPW